LSSASSTPGDHTRFFEGDMLHEGEDNGCESFTGTCVIRDPRRVCVVVASNKSDLFPESLIFGIGGGDDSGTR
jgi:hypothetical protein